MSLPKVKVLLTLYHEYSLWLRGSYNCFVIENDKLYIYLDEGMFLQESDRPENRKDLSSWVEYDREANCLIVKSNHCIEEALTSEDKHLRKQAQHHMENTRK